MPCIFSRSMRALEGSTHIHWLVKVCNTLHKVQKMRVSCFEIGKPSGAELSCASFSVAPDDGCLNDVLQIGWHLVALEEGGVLLYVLHPLYV